MNMLNVGCGPSFHSGDGWTNIDIAAHGAGVIAHDIRDGLPFGDESFDAVYSSHVLEHMTCREAESLLREMHRVLKSGGVLRLVLPDLEQIARLYLEKLDAVRVQNDPAAVQAYEWMKLELMDQMVRDTPCGEMIGFLTREDLLIRDFIRIRVGSEAEGFWKPSPEESRTAVADVKKRAKKRDLKKRVFTVLVRVLLGERYVKTANEIVFRNTGVLHKWMYDSYSASALLEKIGFRDVNTSAPEMSRIEGFSRFSLDVVEGKIRKPDSFFMEGIK